MLFTKIWEENACRNETGMNLGTELHTGTGWSNVLSNNKITIDRDGGIHKNARQNDSKEFYHKEISIWEDIYLMWFTYHTCFHISKQSASQ